MDDNTSDMVKLTSVENTDEKDTGRLSGKMAKEYHNPRTTSMGHLSRNVKWPQHCRRLGPEFTACSRHFPHEAVFCVQTGQLCDGTQDCPYADDEDPTLCLFHRLSMEEMSRIRLAFSHITEKGLLRKHSIVWTDKDGNTRNQNGEFVV
ncbi:unnamed protein product [Strongylus vulgaris]|uniref:Uncharacterized protein n=1 Tax=Strongylus vulgaris TaxID=40348 RepID=A0A3P7JDY1_STRVU|nr:unnamed protein product [Strongylus vulgaris]